MDDQDASVLFEVEDILAYLSRASSCSFRSHKIFSIPSIFSRRLRDNFLTPCGRRPVNGDLCTQRIFSGLPDPEFETVL